MFIFFLLLNNYCRQFLSWPLKIINEYYKFRDKYAPRITWFQHEFEFIFHWVALKRSYWADWANLSSTCTLDRLTQILLPDYKYFLPFEKFVQSYPGFKIVLNFFFFTLLKNPAPAVKDILTRAFGFGFIYLRGAAMLLFIDACLTDDEPLWEPIEWSLIQTWILFIFSFAWIAENLISSRYGSYTGRDKRVWLGWYKTFWLIEGFYMLNYGVVATYVTVPFYFELNYNLSFIYSWWHWYSRVFFYKFIICYSIILTSSYWLQVNIKLFSWQKSLLVILSTTIFIIYLIYTHFIIVFFGYFTDPIWYQKTKPIDYIQLSHEPSRWGWGGVKKDHFTYHNVKTVFWFKNDGPFASAFLMFHLFLFLCLFLLLIFWISLLRRVWSTKEVPVTFTTYCISSLRQFFYFFLCFYIFVFLSFLTHYMRLPWELYYFVQYTPWFSTFISICLDYPSLFFTK